MTEERWSMAESVHRTLTHMDLRDMGNRRDEMRAALRMLLEQRGTPRMAAEPGTSIPELPTGGIRRWTTVGMGIGIDYTISGPSAHLRMTSGDDSILRIDQIDFGKPVGDLVAGDLIEAAIRGIALATESMDLGEDDPRVVEGRRAVDVPLGWAIDLRERRVAAGGDPNETIETRCRTPWGGAACVSYRNDETGERIVPHRPEEEPVLTTMDVRHTIFGSVLRPLAAFVCDPREPLASLHAVAAYRSTLR